MCVAAERELVPLKTEFWRTPAGWHVSKIVQALLEITCPGSPERPAARRSAHRCRSSSHLRAQVPLQSPCFVLLKRTEKESRQTVFHCM